jgi:glycosyltransferase involved in cell wall biosynthesis
MPTPSGEGVSILLPAYQLADQIADNIARTVSAVARVPGVEIIVCDDGSDDGTKDAARSEAGRHDNVSVIAHRPNRGKGAALLEAFNVSSGETVVFLDADLDLPPEQVPDLLDRFTRSGADVMVGAKQQAMAPGRYTGLRRFLSHVFSGVVALLFHLPVTETQTGLKVFTRPALADTLPQLEVWRYSFDLELLARIHRAGFSIVESPVELSEGKTGHGVSLGTLWEMARDTLRIWRASRSWQ